MRAVPWPRFPGLLAQILIFWLLAPLFIRVIPLSRLLRFYSPVRRSPPHGERLKRIPLYLDRVIRVLPLGKNQACLRRCLVLFYFLNRWGEPVAIHFGVRKDEDEKLQGHSWLTRSDGLLWREDPKVHRFFEVAAAGLTPRTEPFRLRR